MKTLEVTYKFVSKVNPEWTMEEALSVFMEDNIKRYSIVDTEELAKEFVKNHINLIAVQEK